MDDRLGPLLTPLEVPDENAQLPQSQMATAELIVRHLKQSTAARDLPVVQLLGADTPSKLLVAAHAARALGLRVYRLPAALLPAQAIEIENLSRLWQRECQLLPTALYVDAIGSDADAAQAGQGAAVSRLLARMGGVIFLDTRDVWPGLTQGSVQVDVAKPSPQEQEAEWAAALGEAALEKARRNCVPVQHGPVGHQTDRARGTSRPRGRRALATPPPVGSLLRSTRPRLDTLAQRLDPKATWKDIVLPAAETSLLQQIAAQSAAAQAASYEAWGFAARKMNRGLRHQRAVCRRKRHRQDDGGRGDRQRSAA